MGSEVQLAAEVFEAGVFVDAHLMTRVTVAHGHRAVFQCLAVDGETERRAVG